VGQLRCPTPLYSKSETLPVLGTASTVGRISSGEEILREILKICEGNTAVTVNIGCDIANRSCTAAEEVRREILKVCEGHLVVTIEVSAVICRSEINHGYVIGVRIRI